MLTKEQRSHRTGWVLVGIVGGTVIVAAVVIALVRVTASPTAAEMATSSFEQLRFASPPEVLGKDEHEEGADYRLRLSKPFAIDQVTIPDGYRRTAQGEYRLGNNNTSLGYYSGVPVEAGGRACDLGFVHEAQAPPDRTLIRLEIRCGYGSP